MLRRFERIPVFTRDRQEKKTNEVCTIACTGIELETIS